MQEIILKKVSVFKTSIDNHLLKTIFPYIESNKNEFKSRYWDCNIQTSFETYVNILHQVKEFKHIRKAIEEKIDEILEDKPFYIFESWLNIYDEGGYQEFHKHDLYGTGGSGVLYLSEKNSAIEFSIFPEDKRTKVIPNKCELLLFDNTTHHRVLDSKNKERMSLAFNFKIHE